MAGSPSADLLAVKGAQVQLASFRSRYKRRSGRTVGAIVAILSSLLLLGIFATSPANAAVTPASESLISLPHVGGHSCVADSASGEQVTWCADLAIYVNGSGQQFVTTQGEAYCNPPGGGYEQCKYVDIQGTVAAPGYTAWTDRGCSAPGCAAGGRNYFYPDGGIALNPGTCVAEVWAAIRDNTIQTFNNTFIFSGISTAHYRVCASSSNVITYTQL
jgi:hypothetical protein